LYTYNLFLIIIITTEIFNFTQDYITEYTHWGYSDIDILMGRPSPFITEEMLSTYDVYTISFGDNERYYMRGQLTIMKNSEKTNNLWKKCHDLAHIGERLRHFYTHVNISRRMDGWRFESAEGCISHVVAHERGIKALSTTNLLSDAFKADHVEKESMLIGGTVLRCYESPLVEHNIFPDELIHALTSNNWLV
jgi:hypothetical protein